MSVWEIIPSANIPAHHAGHGSGDALNHMDKIAI